MPEQDKILEHLQEGILKTVPGSKECNEATRVYNEYVDNLNEQRKNEVEQRLKQNIHDDELVKIRDQALVDEKRFKHQKIIDIAGITLKAITVVVTTIVGFRAIHDDENGSPWFGWKKDFLSNLNRKGN